jgi:TRAP-type transport system small permease protein
MQAMEKGIVWVCQAILWVTMSVIFVILCGNTILRYATGASMQWANELPELLFPWLVMSGVVMGAVYGAHITTSFLRDVIPKTGQRFMSVCTWLAVAALYATLAFATWKMLDIVHDEKSPILGVPGSVTYGCVMVGMILLALLALNAAWRAFTQQIPPSHSAGNADSMPTT